jgi:hypothetical protein
MSLGRRILNAASEVAENLDIFHKWVPEASAEVQGAQMTPVMADGRLVAVDSPFGRIEVAREFTRVGDVLFARIIFFEPPTGLRKEARELYSIRIFDEGAHFGPGPDPDHFDWDPNRDRWMPRNWLRISYELAVAATAPRSVG